ncbi:MAG: hypothetical protein PHU25_09315 [Deltaproteobacteria bacterium]|nr:hypothetical protein [Deltaproteobacteria bacterium]
MRPPGRFAAVIAVAFFAIGQGALAERTQDALKADLDKASADLGKGYTRLGEARAGGLGEGQTATFSYLLKAGVCYRFMAVGGDDVKDLDLRLYGDGALLASDAGAVSRPFAEHCAKADIKAEVRLEMYKGKGSFAFGVFVKGAGAATGGQEALLKDLTAAGKSFGAGMEPSGAPHVGQLGHRETETVEMELDGARCYKFVAVGAPGVTDLNMWILVDGAEVGSDRISGMRPVVEWCAPGRTRASVKLSMYGGSGAYALGVFGAPTPGVKATEKVGGAESDFVANRIRQLHAQLGKGRAASSAVLRGNLATGDEQVFKVRMAGGHCYTIITAGAPSVRDLNLSLVDRGREIQSDKTNTNFPSLDTSPCPAFTGEYLVKVRMFSGSGQFGVQVFSD